MANMSINVLFTRLTLVLGMLVLLSGCNDNDEDGPLLFQMGGAIQGASLNLSKDVSTLAGTAGVFDSSDGIGVPKPNFQNLSV